jgi:hypothetical protein
MSVRNQWLSAFSSFEHKDKFLHALVKNKQQKNNREEISSWRTPPRVIKWFMEGVQIWCMRWFSQLLRALFTRVETELMSRKLLHSRMMKIHTDGPFLLVQIKNQRTRLFTQGLTIRGDSIKEIKNNLREYSYFEAQMYSIPLTSRDSLEVELDFFRSNPF